MANNVVVGFNVGIPLIDTELVDTGINSTNTDIIYAFNPLQSYKPGRTINSLSDITHNKGLLLKMKTVADFEAWLATTAEAELPTTTPEAITWGQFVQASQGTNGGINYTGSDSTLGGGTATKKLTGNGYIQWQINADNNLDQAVPIAFVTVNDGSYNWDRGAGNTAPAGYQGGMFQVPVLGAPNADVVPKVAPETNGGIIPTSGWLRIERSGNNVLYKTSPDKITWTTGFTETGVLAGITDIFIKALFVAPVLTGRKLINVEGINLVAI